MATRALRRCGVGVVGARVEILKLAFLLAAGSILSLNASQTLDATQGALVLGDNLLADGRQEDVQLAVEVVLGDAELPLEKHEELLLHQVDLGLGELKVWGAEVALACAAGALAAAGGDAARSVGVVPDLGVLGPVLVLWRGVVEVLGGEDESSQEDAVGGAAQALGLGL